MKLRRFIATMSAVAVAVSAVSISAYAAIADTEVVLDDSWSKFAQFAAGTITEACTIDIIVKDVQADAQITLKETGGWTAIDLTDKFTTDGASAAFDTQWGVLAISEDTTKITLELDAADAAALKAGGGAIAGKNYTFVSADYAEETDVVVDAPAASEAVYDVDAVLAIQDNVSWATVTSDVVNITGDGEYTFKLDSLSLDPASVTVIYVKDKAAYDGGTEPSDIDSDVAMIASLKINGEEIEVADGYNTMGESGDVLDCCLFNIWGTNYVELPSGTIKSVEFTLVIGDADDTAADDTPTDEPVVDEPVVDAPADDTVVEDVPADDVVDEAPVALTLEECYDGNGTVILVGENGENAYATSNGIDILDVYGYRVTAQFPMAEVNDEAAWIGGGIGTNSNSTGWASTEWGKASGEKPIVTEFDEQGLVTLELLSDASLFAADDAYAQLWVQCWGGTMNIISVEVLGAEGAVIAEATVGEIAAVEDAPAADDTVVDTDAPSADTGKDSPDTGVEGIAAVAGVVALAGAAVVASRKRK